MQKIKCHIEIEKFSLIAELPFAWSEQDWFNILDLFGISDGETLPLAEAKEMCLMAITEFEPPEAANMLLTYRLSERLNTGQIDQISHEMLIDKLSEEYSDVSFHAELFNVNQLLRKAYNGKFPKAKASEIHFYIKSSLAISKIEQEDMKEFVLKSLAGGLPPSAIILRLYDSRLDGTEEFVDAQHIIWNMELKNISDKEISGTVWSSEYWLGELDDISSFDSEVMMDLEAHEH